MDLKLKYDGVKQVKTDLEDEVILTKKIYNQDTGDLDREIEIYFDPNSIPERIAALQAEITNLQGLQTKIETNNFDTIEDKRSVQIK